MTAKPKDKLGCAADSTQKQVFGPRIAKSQPIWIKFCTHLLLYRIHLRADLDRDQRVGGSRPNQNDCYFLCNLVTHPSPIYRRRSGAISAANRQSGGEDGCYREKNPLFCSVGGARSQNSIFSRFGGTLRLSCAQPIQKTGLPKPIVPMESRDYEGVPFASLKILWSGIWEI